MARKGGGNDVVGPPSSPRLYRIWCLRRLFLTCLALPLAAMLMLTLITDAGTTGTVFALGTLLVWAMALGAMLIRFPRATGEALTYALALSIMILLWPLADWLMAQSPQGMTPLHVLGIGFLAIVVFLALVYLLLGSLVALLARPGPRPMLHRKLRLRIDLPPEQAVALLRPGPNRSDALTRSGAPDTKGRFPVWIKPPRMPPGTPAAPPPLMVSPDFWQQVVEEGPLSCATVSVTAKGAQETVKITLEPAPEGSVLHLHSADNILNLAEALFYWLEDAGRDHLAAVLDEALGHPSRALRLLPLDGPMAWLSRRITMREPDGF